MSAEIKEPTIEQATLNVNTTDFSIVKSTNTDGCGGNSGGVSVEEQSQQHSIAPTLPLHSPHSPLLTDENSHHLNKNKLSARYINNATSVESQLNPLQTKLQSNVKNPFQTHTRNPFQSTETEAAPSSKLLCYCEKSGLEPAESPNNNTAFKTCAKRLVATRNAATSPHLDVRKMGSMTTLSPSSLLTNEICAKTKYLQCSKLRMQSKQNKVDSSKISLEKTNSLGDSKPLKQLRTTRSLSPRPPIRQQHAIIVLESNEVDFKPSILSKTTPDEINHKIHNFCSTHKKKVNNLCRSEQSSPNITDGSDMKFTYKETTNHSTGCLKYVPSDPWLKLENTENTSSFYQHSLPPNKKERRLLPAKTLPENIEDPWIKRSDMKSVSKPSRHEMFRQSKSFSSTKFDVDTLAVLTPPISTIPTNRYKLHGSHSEAEEIKSNSAIDVRKQLQSAPSSPHYLTTMDNPFFSSCYLNSQYDIGPYTDTTPIRSSSFSPARLKDCQNPFTDYNNLSAQQPNSPPPLIAVATESLNDEIQTKSKLNSCTTNHSFLNVCNPNFLNSRHSFSSGSNQRHEDEELQLNIRRLSDQLRRKGSSIVDSLTGNMKTYSSDRNVSGNSEETNICCPSRNKTVADKQASLNRADFSDYLEQFRCSEAKKAAAAAADVKDKKKLWEDKQLLKETNSNQTTGKSKTQQLTDRLLETTC